MTMDDTVTIEMGDRERIFLHTIRVAVEAHQLDIYKRTLGEDGRPSPAKMTNTTWEIQVAASIIGIGVSSLLSMMHPDLRQEYFSDWSEIVLNQAEDFGPFDKAWATSITKQPGKN